MAISYSFHISSKKNAITTKIALSSALKHNLRSFSSNDYNLETNEVLIGSDTAKDSFQDFEDFYHSEFDEVLKDYNSTKTKTRDRIENYFDHVSSSKKNDLATEIIIQVGDKNFWENKSLDERKKMTSLFHEQLDRLKAEVPEFKIISAVVHYDEASPHIQAIGVPVAQYEKGLAKRVSKTKVFTKERLESLQATMRVGIEDKMKNLYGEQVSIKAAEKGRAFQYTVQEFKTHQAVIDSLKAQEKALKQSLEKLKPQVKTTYQDFVISNALKNHKPGEYSTESKKISKTKNLLWVPKDEYNSLVKKYNSVVSTNEKLVNSLNEQSSKNGNLESAIKAIKEKTSVSIDVPEFWTTELKYQKLKNKYEKILAPMAEMIQEKLEKKDFPETLSLAKSWKEILEEYLKIANLSPDKMHHLKNLLDLLIKFIKSLTKNLKLTL